MERLAFLRAARERVGADVELAHRARVALLQHLAERRAAARRRADELVEERDGAVVGRLLVADERRAPRGVHDLAVDERGVEDGVAEERVFGAGVAPRAQPVREPGAEAFGVFGVREEAGFPLARARGAEDEGEGGEGVFLGAGAQVGEEAFEALTVSVKPSGSLLATRLRASSVW